MALFQPNTKPATERIKKLKNITTSPTENGSFLATRMATISVPSSDPPYLTTSPTPTPRITPPNTAASRGSTVIGFTGCSNCVPIDIRITANKVDKAKVLPICL
ncbi:hypothetical protein D3C73_1369730 [compost metagenome]